MANLIQLSRCLIIFCFLFLYEVLAEDVKPIDKEKINSVKTILVETQQAKEILEATALHGGLCLHLDCGRIDSSGLTAALAESSNFLVHGLAIDDNALNRARVAIDMQGVAGRAMVEKFAEKSLPYLTELAGLIVVEDLTTLKNQGISSEEILRVLEPGGKLCVKENGKWIITTKPRPKELDEWTHNHHGPDGNLVSNDKPLTFPLNLRWLDGLPNHRGGFGDCAGSRAMVVAGGRIFTISVDDVGNLIPARKDAYLMARDAFNGFPLWKINCNDSYGQLNWNLILNGQE